MPRLTRAPSVFRLQKVIESFESGNLQMNSAERSLLESLDGILSADSVRAQIKPIVERVARKLARDRKAPMAWEPIPLPIYGDSLPQSICSSWVFILRAGGATGAERHPNSHQRMMAYQGTGDLQTGGEGHWQSHLLVSTDGVPLEHRWLSIPANVWHQAVVADEDWVVVSFHTVAAEQLIEERPDAADPGRTHQRRYLAPDADSPAQNKALVRRYYEEMWNRWDFALADKLVSEEVAFRGSLGITVHGREGFKEYMRAVRRAFPDFHNHVEELVAEDDRVVARLTYTGTHEGELFSIRATGRRVTYVGVAIFRIAAGHVAEGWVLGDLHGLVQQISVAGAE
jgi:steroid delta-isomerase-like uncharacterized protein